MRTAVSVQCERVLGTWVAMESWVVILGTCCSQVFVILWAGNISQVWGDQKTWVSARRGQPLVNTWVASFNRAPRKMTER